MVIIEFTRTLKLIASYLRCQLKEGLLSSGRHLDGWLSATSSSVKLATVDDLARLRSLTSGSRSNSLESIEYFETFRNLAEHDMLSIKMRGCNEAKEELAAVGVGASVCHGENTTASVSLREILVFEAATVDRLTTTAIATSEVATLSHEARNNSVEHAALKVQILALLSHALLACAEAAEVLSGPWGVLGVECDDDSSC